MTEIYRVYGKSNGIVVERAEASGEWRACDVSGKKLGKMASVEFDLGDDRLTLFLSYSPLVKNNGCWAAGVMPSDDGEPSVPQGVSVSFAQSPIAFSACLEVKIESDVREVVVAAY